MAVLELGRRLWADDRNVTTRDFGAFGETLALEIGTEPDRRHEIQTGLAKQTLGVYQGKETSTCFTALSCLPGKRGPRGGAGAP